MRGWPLNRTGPSGLRDSCRTREDKAARSGVGPSDRLRRALRTGLEPRRSTHGNAYGAGGAGPGHRPGVTAGPAHLHVYTAGDRSPTAAGEVCSGQGRVGRVEMANILLDKETFLGASLADTQRPLQGKHHFYDLIH